MDFSLLNMDNILRAIGRGVIAFATATDADDDRDPILWDGTTELELKQLGDTEGDIIYTPNGADAILTLPELSGEAPREVTHLGYAPLLDFPLFLVDPDLYPIINERGISSGGSERVCDPTYFTAVVFPERLFREADCSFDGLTYSTAEGWKLGGVAFTAAQLTMLETVLWLWKVYAKQSNIEFKGGHGDDGKNIAAVQFVSVWADAMPNDHHLWTRGDPNTQGIDLDGMS